MSVTSPTRVILFLCLLAMLPCAAPALERQKVEQLMASLKAGHNVLVGEFLEDNSEALADDPDYYVILLNYAAASSQMLAIGTQGDNPAFELTDKDTGEVIGYIGSHTNTAPVVEAIERTVKAQPSFRNRLDIHFGMISIASNLKMWREAGERMVQLLRESRAINNKWIWGPVNREGGGQSQDFLIQNILAHCHTLFNAQDPDADRAFEQVARALIEFYPELIYGYANMGIVHMLKRDLDTAEDYLQKALKIDPSDKIVQGNLQWIRENRQQISDQP